MEFKESITFLGTKDLKKTSFFYQNILELTLYKDQGYFLIFNINYQSKIGFCKHISIVYDDKSPIITLVTEEVDEQYFNIYHFFFKDPNGYTIEIQKFLGD